MTTTYKTYSIVTFLFALIVALFLLSPHIGRAFGPWLTLSSHTSAPGGTVVASGGGFAPHEGVGVSIAGGVLAGATTNDLGSFSGKPVVVPQKPAGSYTALATGDHRDQASANFYISGYYPVAAPSAWYVLPGQTLTFSGHGFAPSEVISISNVVGSAASANADGSGAFTSGSMLVPFEWQGTSRTIQVAGATSDVSIPLTIKIGTFYPQIEPSTYYAAFNSSVTIDGRGFAPNESVILSSNDTQLGQRKADGSGAVHFSLTMPTTGSSITFTAKGSLSLQSSSRTINLHP